MYLKFYISLFSCVVVFNSVSAQTISISGQVTLHNGEPLTGIMVTCTNADPVLSDENGFFTFSNLPQGEDYLINGMYETDIYDGVTALDFLFMANVILAINEINSAVQLVAGDYNASGTLSAFDLVLARKAILRQELILNGPHWSFFNGNTSIPNSGIYISNATDDVEGLQLVAAKRGNMALEADHLPAPVNAPEPVYYFADQQVAAGAEFEVNVQVDDFQSIAGFQHGLQWDNSVADFVSLEFGEGVGGDINQNLTEDGNLLVFAARYLENNESYLYLEDGATAYTVTFQANQAISGLGDFLQFSEEIIPAQTVFATSTHRLYLLPDTYQSGVVTSSMEPENLADFKLMPNITPEHSEVWIRFASPESGILQLLDMNGRLLKSWKVEGIDFRKMISMTALARGTYALQLRTKSGILTRRIIKY